MLKMSNENTKNKARKNVEVTFPDGHTEEILGCEVIANKINIDRRVISYHLGRGTEYRGYKFKEIPK